MAKLTARQRLFVAEYLKDLNAKRAAVRAGYSEKSNNSRSRLMANEAVRDAIDGVLRPPIKQLEITAERVLSAMYQTQRRGWTKPVRHVPSPRVRGEGGGSRMRGS
ncbi:terminase small subunit [Rhizobium pisi]|uniref:terminase small subunit n=1 Tax=Rhizobium pisi TaxID=574561 RepID=UPI0039AECCC5